MNGTGQGKGVVRFWSVTGFLSEGSCGGDRTGCIDPNRPVAKARSSRIDREKPM
jgi:hypothetical protein